MAYTVQLVYGSTTVDLSAGVYAISYTPRDPGGRDTVVETATVRVLASSLATLQSAARDIENAFEAARRRRLTGVGDRVYLKFQESGDSDTYRSELWADSPGDQVGRVNVQPFTMLDHIFTGNKGILQVIWSRKGYWEDDSETELSLENNSGSGTGGIVVRNPHTTAVFSGTTVSFTAATNTISDSGNGFGGFTVGDVISLRGSTSNDGIYTVATVAAGAITTNEPVPLDEVAGDSVSIYALDNYVHIDSADIAGVAAAGGAACRIEMTNDDAGADLQTVWMGNNYLSTPLQFAHILETADSDTGSDTGDAGASSGQYRAYATSTTEAKITGWTITSETLAAAASRYFKVMIRYFNGTSITSVKLRIKILYGSQVIYSGPQVEYDDTYAGISRLWREIDTVQLPPFKLEGSTPTDLTFELWGEATSGTPTINIDELELVPVDGYRKLHSAGGVAQNSILIDDGVLETYYQSVSSEIVRDVAVEGKPIQLYPGINNRIYFIQHSETANTADLDRSMTIQIYYRPRRITL